MKVWILKDLVCYTPEGFTELKQNHIYEMSDYWGKLIIEAEAGAEYILIK